MKSALRRIVVEDQPFFWSISGEIDHASSTERTILHLRVWGPDRSCRPLLVDLARDEWGYTYLLPRDVALLIAADLAQGWHPGERGAPFRLASIAAPVLERWHVI